MLKAIMVAVDSLRSAAQPTGMLQPCQFDVPLVARVAKLRDPPGKSISFNFNTDSALTSEAQVEAPAFRPVNIATNVKGSSRDCPSTLHN